MASTSLIFYPENYVGFNKTRLLERRLLAEGILGSKMEFSSAFNAGPQFWRLILKDINLQKSSTTIPRISIQSVSVWAQSDRLAILERTNTLLIEGDIKVASDKSLDVMCGLLKCITGDVYLVASLPAFGEGSGIAEPRLVYAIEG
ncbi:hypothetical protein [Cellvibrio sp. UBA7661]|uniref:hypothetical protein n=1 Tax=Cellvibrio sp. UBA7661 TaxID=1946311 RepID=UPI002F352526